MKSLQILRLSLALLLVAATAQAREHPAFADSGGFDHFLLSLSLAPSFCELTPANRSKAECQALTQADFEQTPLTLHGLWPNRARLSVNRQPHDCDGPPFEVSRSVQAELRRMMPAGPGLERYEWRKHGTCSGLSPERYFAMMAQLGQRANDTIGGAMRARHMLGNVVRISDLLEAVAATDPDLAPAVIVSCRRPRGAREALIEEIRVTLSKDFLPIPASDVGMGQNSGCPGGAGRVPNVTE